MAEQVNLLVITACNQMSSIFQIDNRSNCCSMTCDLGLHLPVPGIPENQRRAPMITTRGQEPVLTEIPDHRQAAYRRCMSPQRRHLLSTDRVDINSLILRPRRYKLLIDKENAQNRILMISHNSFLMIKTNILAILYHCTLLVWTYVL